MRLHDHGECPVIGAAFDVPARDPELLPETVRFGRGRHLAQAQIDALR
jgi:hypothetical protein